MGGLDMEQFSLSDNTDRSDLINEALSDPMLVYYERVTSTGEWGRGKILGFIAILGKRESERERGSRRICLERIFTTGPTPGEYSRYGRSI